MSYKIIHITVHLGGGIGTVLWNWVRADRTNEHKILCLNYNYYSTYDERVVDVYENMKDKYEDIEVCLELADIVVVHFWNHPLLFQFLITAKIPPCRMCFWSHVSGLNAPYIISEKLVRFSDRFVFSSPISYKGREIRQLPDELKGRLSHIWTTGNIAEFSGIKPAPHEGFNIGFVGTLDYSKLHPNFIDICSRINIPDVKFIMIGGGCDADKIKQQVRDIGLNDKFIFTGVIGDIKPYLAILDVLGYPLNPNHFGTCEQVLGEATAAGVIPIVMKNPAEEYILLQSLVRFVCDDEEQYIHNIELLYKNRNKRANVISLIQESVVDLYSSEKMVVSWQALFNEVMTERKRRKVWKISKERAKLGGAGIFIESLGEYGDIFERNDTEAIKKLFASNLQWSSQNKGSPRQYLDTFKGDPILYEWAKLAERK